MFSLLSTFRKGLAGGTGRAMKGENKAKINTGMDFTMHRQEISVRGKPTEFLSLGGNATKTPKNIFLIIPGNPGVASYYKDFMKSLYSGVKETHAVWAISHAGHCDVSNLPLLPNGQHVYNLEEQVQHKIAFILDYVPRDTKITLIGHSIGCYIILQILKAFEANTEVNIDKNYLLFPTVERMKITPNGQFLWPVFCYFRWLVIFLTMLTFWLPGRIKYLITSFYFRGKNVPECSLQATVEMIHPKIIQNILWMAYNELLQVVDADIEVIEKYKEKLVFYYGADDGWCPKSYRNDLMANVEGLRAHLCEDGFQHAFVLSSLYSEGMANKITTWSKS